MPELRSPSRLRRWSMPLLIGSALACGGWPVLGGPDPRPPGLEVSAELPGAAPELVEQLLAEPLEASLMAVPGLIRLDSTCEEGLVVLELGLTATTDAWTAAGAARELLAEQTGLPGDVLPTLRVRLPTQTHTVVLSGADLRSLSISAMDLERELWRIPGLLESTQLGNLTEQTEVRVDGRKLVAFGLSIDQVVSAIETRDLPVGDGLLRVPASRSPEELGRLPVGHGVLRLGDVASIELGALPRSGRVVFEGEPAVALQFGLDAASEAQAMDAVHELLGQQPAARLLDQEGRMVYELRGEGAEFIDDQVARIGAAWAPAQTLSIRPETPGTRAELWVWGAGAVPITQPPGFTLRARPARGWALVVRGMDRAIVDAVASGLVTTLAARPGVEFVDLDRPAASSASLQLSWDREAAARLGLGIQELTDAWSASRGRLLSSSGGPVWLIFEGLGEADHPATLQLPLLVQGELRMVPLASVAQIRMVAARTSLSRRDGLPSARVVVDLEQVDDPEATRRWIEAEVAKIPRPSGVAVVVEEEP